MIFENGRLICNVTKPEICVEEYDLDKASTVSFSEITVFFLDVKNKHKLDFVPRGSLPKSKVIVDYDAEKLASKYKNLKEYSGTYRMCGFGYWGDENFEGEVTYKYEDAPDGTRFFEGPFSFSFSTGFDSHFQTYSGECNGSFKNNKQIGRWMWTNSKGKVISSLYFNQNGEIDGNFFIPQSWGTFKNGKLIHLHDYQVVYSEKTYTLEGDFSEYKPGVPIGEWKIRGEKVPNKSITIKYDNNGKQVDAYYIESSTGDKHYIGEGYRLFPSNAYETTIQRLSNRCVRSTPKLDKRH